MKLPTVRVHLLTDSSSLAGTERQVALLAEGLACAGVHVEVSTIWKGRSASQDSLNGARDAGVRVHPPLIDRVVPRSSSSVQLFELSAASRGLRQRLDRSRSNLLHASMSGSEAVSLLTTSLMRRRIPRILWRRYMTDAVSGNPARTLVRKISFRSADLVIANSTKVLDDAVRQREVPAGRGTVILNGIRDRDIVDRPPSSWQGGVPLKIVTIANYGQHKGIVVAEEVARRLADAGLRFSWAFVGAGYPSGFGDCDSSHLGRIYAPGTTPDVLPHVDEAHLMIHPSLTEGVPNAVLEAMARGKAIVATDVGGTAEALGEAGVLVPSGDAEALFAAVLELTRTPQVMAILGEQALLRAKRLSASEFTYQHLRLFEKVLAGHQWL